MLKILYSTFPMDPLLSLLKANARASDDELARQLNTTPDAVRQQIAAHQKSGVIRAFQALVNEDCLDDAGEVNAVIELQVRPEREGGFDRIAMRIARFPEVQALYLVSGGFDLLLFVKGRSLQEVAGFVSAKLAPLDGVRSTATHFTLKTYKHHGVMMEKEERDERLQISP